MKTFIALLIMFLFLCYSVYMLDRNITKGKEKYRNEIGKTIIVGKDTLKILDYSTFQENFTLSNGATVSYEFVKNNAK